MYERLSQRSETSARESNLPEREQLVRRVHTSTAIRRLAAVFGYVSEPRDSGRDCVAGGETEVERPLSAGAANTMAILHSAN